jgi:hypothetical protein
LKTKPSSKVKKKDPPGPHPLHIAKQFQQQLETGSVNKAELARRHGMSRARVTQIMNLLNLESRIKRGNLKYVPIRTKVFHGKKASKNSRTFIPQKAVAGLYKSKIRHLVEMKNALWIFN